MEKIRIATRGSKLALWQSEYIAKNLLDLGYQSELKIIKTKGDIVQDRFLHEIGGKGVFIKELEKSLEKKDCDIAMHSMKDLPAVIKEPFLLPAIMERHNHKDVIIFHPDKAKEIKLTKDQDIQAEQLKSLGEITIATASLRRQSLLKATSKQIKLEPVRGNVDTRIGKLMDGNWDALILAAAAIERLGYTDLDYWYLCPDWFVPSAAQGALAIESINDNQWINAVRKLNCALTERCVTMERKVLELLGGDCTMPIGVHIYPNHEGGTSGKAIVLDYEGRFAKTSINDNLDPLSLNPDSFVTQIMAGLKENQVSNVLKSLNLKIPELGNL